jgi:hypothetical protein
MKKRIAIFAAATAMMTVVPMLSAADESKSWDGQYFCIVEHVAGLKWEDKEKNQPMFSGKMKIPDEDMKFFIKIGPFVYDDIRREVCANDINYWFKEVFEKGIPYPDHAPGGKNADLRQWIGGNCFASDEITWKSSNGKQTWNFRGYGSRHEFYGWSTGNWFKFYHDVGNTFMMGFEYDSGPVIEYGHCTKIEPPK